MALRLGRPDGTDDAALEDAEELGLEAEGHLADLVEEDGAPLGLREEPWARRGGAGEGAAHVPEQLALEQRLGHGRAVDGDEGVGRAAALVVEGAGDQVLARPGLAVDEHRRGGVGDPEHEGADVTHRAVLADDRLDGVHLRERLAQRSGLVAEARLGERAIEEQDQLVHLERLGEVVVRALADRLDGGVDGAEGGHHDDRPVRGGGA